VVNINDNTVSKFTIGTDGSLTRASTAVATGLTPFMIAID
jgi:hypothetical protein